MSKPKINLNGVNGDRLVLASLAYYALRNAGQRNESQIVFDWTIGGSDIGTLLVRLSDLVECTWDDPDALSVTDDDYDYIFEVNQALGDYDPADYPNSAENEK